MGIIVPLMFCVIGLSILLGTSAYASNQYEMKGNGISLDNSDNPALYKSTMRLKFNDLSEITHGAIIIRSEENTLAIRMMPEKWQLSYNADGSFSAHGPGKTLQNKDYFIEFSGERNYIAKNWSMWTLAGKVESSDEQYSLQMIVSGNDRFSNTKQLLEKTIIIPMGNSDQSQSSSYIPNKPTVFRGSTVSWLNLDQVGHTVQSQDGEGNVIPLFNSDVLKAGQKFQYKFSEPGTYNYFCTLHPWRSGTIIVS